MIRLIILFRYVSELYFYSVPSSDFKIHAWIQFLLEISCCHGKRGHDFRLSSTVVLNLPVPSPHRSTPGCPTPLRILPYKLNHHHAREDIPPRCLHFEKFLALDLKFFPGGGGRGLLSLSWEPSILDDSFCKYVEKTTVFLYFVV